MGTNAGVEAVTSDPEVLEPRVEDGRATRQRRPGALVLALGCLYLDGESKKSKQLSCFKPLLF